MEKIKEFFKKTSNKAKELCAKIATKIKEAYRKIAEKTKAFLDKAAAKFKELSRPLLEKLKAFWEDFSAKHPKASEWVREGGLFLIVSTLITIFKYLILTFLPLAFAFMGDRDFGFPGIDVTLFGIDFKWYIIGYGKEQGGLGYFTAYMIAMVIGEVINFFMQRKYVFRSNGNILYQGGWYLLAFALVTCVVNSINCVWAAVAGHFVGPWLYNIGTTMLNGTISMVVFFIVNKIVFNDKKEAPEGEAEQSVE